MKRYGVRRKYRSRRPVRRLARRSLRSALAPRSNYKPNTYCQSFVSTITSTASTDMLIAHKVKFSDLPNYADFQKLFQQYKINWFEVRFVPTHNVYDPNNGTTYSNVPIYYAVDYDQDATPAVADILRFGNLKIGKFSRGFKIRVYPTTTVTGSSTNEIKRKSKSVWLDTTNADQYHNGLDVAIPTQGWASSAMLIGNFITKLCFSVKLLDGTNN